MHGLDATEQPARLQRGPFQTRSASAATSRRRSGAWLPSLRSVAPDNHSRLRRSLDGFSPRKAAHVTAEVRAEAAMKLRATRAARGTLGSRQKEHVHGSLETPAPAPAPVVTPAPAPVVTNGVNGSNGATQPMLLSLNGSSH